MSHKVYSMSWTSHRVGLTLIPIFAILLTQILAVECIELDGREITGSVKDFSLAGNIYDLLPQVVAISHETSWFIDNMTETSC